MERKKVIVLEEKEGVTADTTMPNDAIDTVSDVAAKPKRKRRTKAEMESLAIGDVAAKPKRKRRTKAEMGALAIGDVAVKPKRKRRTKAEMGALAIGDVAVKPGMFGSADSIKLRQEIERMTKKADALEHRETIRTLRSDIKAYEGNIKHFQREIDLITKLLNKTKAKLVEVEGPGKLLVYE